MYRAKSALQICRHLLLPCTSAVFALGGGDSEELMVYISCLFESWGHALATAFQACCLHVEILAFSPICFLEVTRLRRCTTGLWHR